MFAVQLALIWFAEKDDYGAYSLLMSYVLMGQAILSSVFGAPLITSTSPLGADARDARLARAVRWHAIVTLSLGTAAAPLLYLALPSVGLISVLLTVLTFLGLAMRDLQRIAWTIEGKLERALFNSVAFGMLTATVLGLIYLRAGTVSLASAMTATSIAAIVTAAGPLLRRAGRVGALGEAEGPGLAHHAPWTLPGVIVIWIQNNLHLTIVALLISLTAVAEVSAGRMVAMPYLVAAGGLLRFNQVRFGQQLAAEGSAAAFASAKRWVLVHLALGAALACLAWIAFAGGAQALISDKYPQLLALSSLWLLFAGVTSARGALSAFLQALGAYRTILIVNLTTIPTAVIGIVLLLPLWGVAGAIVPLIAAELQFLLVLFWLLHRRYSKDNSR